MSRLFRLPSPTAISVFLILFTWLIAACTPQESVNPAAAWEYADLRELSAPDQVAEAGDFIAGYSRVAGADFQIRFDFLDMSGFAENDYYIALDYQPGGSYELPLQASAGIAWDSLLFLPTSGTPQVLSPASVDDFQVGSPTAGYQGDPLIPTPRIVRNPWQDFVLVSINQAFLPDLSHGMKIQAFSTQPGTLAVRDAIGPFSSSTLPPEKAPLLLTFWDSFPAYSPAQALRKWDGAHTGPYGERHGLAILLENIRKFSVPAALLDLRNPASLSALDHLGVLPQVDELRVNKMLILPDSLPGSPSFPLFPDGMPGESPDLYLARAKEISENFDLPPSNMLFLPRTMEYIPGYSRYFTPISPGTQYPGQIPLPPQAANEPQSTQDGLSLAIRRTLVKNALHREEVPGRFPLLVLGGSLQTSAFGDPAASSAAFSYIANHPWIDPIDIDDLRSLPAETDFQFMPGSTRVSNGNHFSPSPSLSRLPEPDSSNPIVEETWSAAFSLYSPLPPEAESLAQLRAAYSGQPGILSAAGIWAAAPYSATDCRLDLDWDGFAECILASENQFAVIDELGARLIAYFYRDSSGVHQVVAPTSQFIVGLGDPSTWIMDAADGADPAGIHGAFADSPPPWPLYSYSENEDGLTFFSPDQQIQKNFSLRDAGLAVAYHSRAPVIGRIPIVIDPWTRFSPGWSGKLGHSPIEGGYQFTRAGQNKVAVISSTPLNVHSFADSSGTLAIPEDPNYDYPPGHYLPFPVNVIDYHGQGDFNLNIQPAWQSNNPESQN